MHPACPNQKQNHLQNSLLRRTQFWVRKIFSKPASLKRASLVIKAVTFSIFTEVDKSRTDTGSKRPEDPPAPRSFRTNAHLIGLQRRLQLRLQISISGTKKRTLPLYLLVLLMTIFICLTHDNLSLSVLLMKEILCFQSLQSRCFEARRGPGRAWNLPCSRPLLLTCLEQRSWSCLGGSKEAHWIQTGPVLIPVHRKRVWKDSESGPAWNQKWSPSRVQFWLCWSVYFKLKLIWRDRDVVDE